MGPRPNMTRVRINRGETDVYRKKERGNTGKSEARG